MPTLPISAALREAQPESISELYSRDVESLSDSDIDRIIHEQRAHRERMEAAEAAGIRLPRTPREPRSIREDRNVRPAAEGIGGDIVI